MAPSGLAPSAGATATARHVWSPARAALFPHTYAGYLIVVEGLDGSGKTTLITSLARALTAEGEKVLVAKQPTDAVRRTALFNRYQYEPEQRSRIEYRAFLATLLSDRFQNAFEVIRPALARGETVIMDRYVHTLIVMMRARGYEENWVLEACSSFPKPDLAWLLHVPFSVAEQRIRNRIDAKDSYVEAALFERIHNHFLVIAAQGDLELVDSHANSPEQLLERMLRQIKTLRHRPADAAADDLA